VWAEAPVRFRGRVRFQSLRTDSKAAVQSRLDFTVGARMMLGGNQTISNTLAGIKRLARKRLR